MNSANSTLVDMINNTIVKFSFSFHRNNFKSFDKTKHTSAAWVEKKEKCGEFLCLKFILSNHNKLTHNNLHVLRAA